MKYTDEKSDTPKHTRRYGHQPTLIQGAFRCFVLLGQQVLAQLALKDKEREPYKTTQSKEHKIHRPALQLCQSKATQKERPTRYDDSAKDT